METYINRIVVFVLIIYTNYFFSQEKAMYLQDFDKIQKSTPYMFILKNNITSNYICLNKMGMGITISILINIMNQNVLIFITILYLHRRLELKKLF